MTEEEKKLFRLYGKLPTHKNVLTKMQKVFLSSLLTMMNVELNTFMFRTASTSIQGIMLYQKQASGHRRMLGQPSQIQRSTRDQH